MAVKIKFAKPAVEASASRELVDSARCAARCCVLVALVGFSVFGFFYFKYQRHCGRAAQAADLRQHRQDLRRAARGASRPKAQRAAASPTSCARPATRPTAPRSLRRWAPTAKACSTITVHPGPQSYHAPDGATIRVSGGVVDSIADDHGQPLSSYELEPLLITGLSDDANRTKRRLLTYDEIPPNLVHAVLAIEDRRFFEHSGVNYVRMSGRDAQRRLPPHAYAGRRVHAHHAAGARLLPHPRNAPTRAKSLEIVITFQLEHRFTKQQIFEMYANEVPLGQRGSFSIDGFGEASQAYFGKDVRQLDLAECALLAGLIQSPSHLNPFRHPERAIERRNLVLDSMVETGAITKEQAETAKAEPLHLVPGSVDASEAPYFVDLVHDQLTQRLGDRDFNREGLRIYTSLDPESAALATGCGRLDHSRGG